MKLSNNGVSSLRAPDISSPAMRETSSCNGCKYSGCLHSLYSEDATS